MKKGSKVGCFFLGMLLMATLFTISIPVLAAQTNKQLDAYYKDIKIVVDGVLITPKDATGKVVEPFVVDGTTYLPVRALATAFGKDVFWEQETNTVFVFSIPQEGSLDGTNTDNK